MSGEIRDSNATARRMTAAPPEPVGRFSFEGVDVEAFSSGGRWHVSSAGCEVTDDHLGTATRILFNPSSHADTGPLIDEILRWHAAVTAADHAEDQATVERARRAPRRGDPPARDKAVG
jgi:hypothetical protein